MLVTRQPAKKGKELAPVSKSETAVIDAVPDRHSRTAIDLNAMTVQVRRFF